MAMEGTRVTYTKAKDVISTGMIEAQIMMIEDKKEKGVFAVTGFLILDDEDGEFKQIAYWRLLHYAKTNQGILKGGFNRKDRLGNIDQF